MRMLDSSSLFESVMEGNVEDKSGAYTLDLARYELGNIVWKKANLLKDISYQDSKKLMNVIINLLKAMKMVNLSGHENEVLNLANDESLSFYDAAYIEAAMRMGLVLVTEDRRILRVCERLGHPAATLAES